MGKYRADEPWYLWYCGTKKYREGDGTGSTVEKWYRGAAEVPWYRATLLQIIFSWMRRLGWICKNVILNVKC